MAFESIPGLNKVESFFSDFDAGGIGASLGLVLTFIILFVFIAGIIGFFLYKNKEKKLYKEKLHFFEEVRGQFVPVEDLVAAELIVPNTDVRVFYVKSKDLYLPRGTRKMGKNSYWYAIRDNKEIINFIMTNLNKEMKEAKLDYDHTDMRYAHLNLREIIKRSYRDKSTKWWKEYKDVIATIIFIFVMSLSFFFLFSQVGKLIGQITPLLDKSTEILGQLAKFDSSCSGLKEASSGIIT